MVKKLLIIDSFLHEKNKQGLMKILHYINTEQIEYKVGTVSDIPNYDIIYSPSEPINASLYPSKKFIFGPHFSTFPVHNQLQSIKNATYHNSIYVQPSEWVVHLWKNMGAEQFLPVKSFPFPVDTNKFKPIPNPEIMKKESSVQEANVLVYYKHRIPYELNILKNFSLIITLTITRFLIINSATMKMIIYFAYRIVHMELFWMHMKVKGSPSKKPYHVMSHCWFGTHKP